MTSLFIVIARRVSAEAISAGLRRCARDDNLFAIARANNPDSTDGRRQEGRLNVRMRIKPGVTSSVLGLGGTGAIGVWPAQTWIGVLLIVAAVIVFAAGIEIDGAHLKFGWPLRRFAHAQKREPLWKAVEHVRNAISDRNDKEVFPAARTALRQAALDGHVHIYGHKSERLMGAGGNYSLVSTLIPQAYWEAADIGPLATDAQFADRFDCMTFPHQMSDGRFGKEIELYAKCTVIWREVVKQWS